MRRTTETTGNQTPLSKSGEARAPSQTLLPRQNNRNPNHGTPESYYSTSFLGVQVFPGVLASESSREKKGGYTLFFFKRGEFQKTRLISSAPQRKKQAEKTGATDRLVEQRNPRDDKSVKSRSTVIVTDQSSPTATSSSVGETTPRH